VIELAINGEYRPFVGYSRCFLHSVTLRQASMAKLAWARALKKSHLIASGRQTIALADSR
jgi:hypothetical protein